MKILIGLVFSIATSIFLICCSKKEQTLKFNLKVTPFFLEKEQVKNLIQDTLPESSKTRYSTYDAQFDDYTNQLAFKPINLRATNYIDEFSRFQIVQYDDDFNGVYNDSTDKIFFNTFNNEYLHTIDYKNFTHYKQEFIVQVSYLFYKIKFLSDDQLRVKRVHKQQADLTFHDKIPNIEVRSSQENKMDLHEIISKGNSYVYHMAYDCKPCIKSIPEINEFKKENPNINIVGLVTRKKERQHLDKLNKLTENWEVFGISNPSKNHQKIFRGLPEMILIDDEGYYLSKSTWIK